MVDLTSSGMLSQRSVIVALLPCEMVEAKMRWTMSSLSLCFLSFAPTFDVCQWSLSISPLLLGDGHHDVMSSFLMSDASSPMIHQWLLMMMSWSSGCRALADASFWCMALEPQMWQLMSRFDARRGGGSQTIPALWWWWRPKPPNLVNPVCFINGGCGGPNLAVKLKTLMAASGSQLCLLVQCST